MTKLTRKSKGFLAGAAALLLVGCGDSTPPSYHGVEVQTISLVAEFEMSRSSVAAGEPVVFDASATRGGEGHRIYTWNFGNGRLGGTSKIPQLFSEAGKYRILLTVTDEAGNQSTAEKWLEVTEGPGVAGEMELSIEVVDLDGVPQTNARVAITGLDGVWETDADGKVSVHGLAYDRAHTIRIHKDGYASQVVRKAFVSGVDRPAVRAVLMPITERIQVEAIQAGGEARSVDGARVVFPQESVVDIDGNPVTGTIDVTFTLLDVSGEQRAAFPGGFEAVNTAGQEGLLMTYGVMDVTLSQNGAPVQIAPGRSATIEIPMYNEGYVPDRDMEIWSLDEATGVWVQEGWGRTVASPDSPTGVVLRGEATHFSWWNADVWASTPCILEFIPTCTNEEGVEVPVPGQMLADVHIEMAPAEGYDRSCTPLPHTRNVNSYRHGTSFPSGTRLEGQMCDPAFADVQCYDQSGSVPAGVTCKIKPYGRTNIDVGVCTRATGDVCPDYMYCDPTKGPDGTGGCTLPFYRYGRADQASISLFQNWNGWDDTRGIFFDEGTTNRKITHGPVPMGPLNLTVDLYCAPELGHECTGNSSPVATFQPAPIKPVTYDGIVIENPFHSAGLPPDVNWRPPTDWTCTPEPTKINIGLCEEAEPVDDEPACEPGNPSYPECCDEPGNECPTGEIVVECIPSVPLGVNDIPGFCEIDAIIVNRTSGFVTEPLFITKTEVDMNLPEAQRGVAEPETISSINFNTCDPGDNGSGWKPHVGYIRSQMVVEFAGELRAGDMVRVFRQGVPANEMNDEGQNCAASGTISVTLPGASNPLVENFYNSFEVRIRDQHLP